MKSYWNIYWNDPNKKLISANLSTPSFDRVLWKYLKVVIKDAECLKNIVNIANICINLYHWLLYFKSLFLIIISKPNKVFYNSPRSFCPIVLLNMLRKLIEKIISEKLQFQLISKNIVHPNQLGELKQHLTMDAGIFITYLIHSSWVKNLQMSILALDIIQFFLSLNH